MDVVLVGLPGSGKSAIGRRLAHRHDASYIDLDETIEREAGVSVPEIFAEEGEEGFRARERAAVAALGSADPAAIVRRVVATGGGAVVDPRNRWLLYRGRLPIWLDGRPEVLAQRLRRSPNVRPLVAGRDPIGSVRALAVARERFYGAAKRVNGVAEVGSVIDTVDALVTEATDRFDPAAAGTTTLLRAETRIGRIEIGDGVAAAAIDDTLRRLEARRAILVSEPGGMGAGRRTDRRRTREPRLGDRTPSAAAGRRSETTGGGRRRRARVRPPPDRAARAAGGDRRRSSR
jgi:shikimate kinase